MAEGTVAFDTAVGRCTVVWGPAGIVRILLPGERAEADGAASDLDAGEAPPAEVRAAIDGIVALLDGGLPDLSTVPLDMRRVPLFDRRVYEVARSIGAGRTLSYGEVAERLGDRRRARAVGQALGRNPFPIVVPCHRVVAASGKVGGFSAPGGATTKRRLLAIEGAPGHGEPSLFDTPKSAPAGVTASVAHLRGADPVLASVIDAVGPLELEVRDTSTTFSTLAKAIVHQQLSNKAAATIYGRLCALFPGGPDGLCAEDILPANPDDLRGAGLSRAKVLALQDLAARTASGEVPSLDEARKLDDGALVERLTRVRGIGRWSAEMFLIFHLGRPDVLPLADVGLRRAVTLAYGLDHPVTAAELEDTAARWRPYRSVACRYLWRRLELAS
jgi:methylated-DNA-[protein]-cysteine S-methyltransferase